MPIYEYECDKCQNVIEVWQSISEAPKTECPECDGQLRKIISRSAFHLKGGGWFSDGYSDTKKGCGAGSSCPAKSEESKKTDAAPTCPKADGAPCCAA